jgi:hypothetical protein
MFFQPMSEVVATSFEQTETKKFSDESLPIGPGDKNSRYSTLADCFDFSRTPVQFQTIAAPITADYFLNDKRTPAGPDDD